MNSATFMGKNFHRQSEFHCEYHRSHTDENVRHICKISGRTRWNLKCGYDSLGKTLMEISVIDWWRNHHQSSTRESLRLFRFSVVSLEGQDRMDHNFSKLQRLWWNQLESQLNSSGTFSQDSLRCSSMVKSQIYWATWEKHQKFSQEEFYLCDCSMTSSCDRKGNKGECLANARVVKVLARKFGVGQWSFIGPGSEKKWYSSENSPQGA